MNTFIETRFDTVRDWIYAYRARRNMARTRRFLSALPHDIQKDIGWPDGRLYTAPLSVQDRQWNAESFLARTECRLP